ncbi:UbiA family prenyltransferase [Nocardioides sp. LML1-1-1.1]|uniref:UbiA family prenyltransferase n=1 Tax=Nocardioides sp. LML1-1-1.1 TaxID=3135248 RepID=UPI003424DBD3
MAKMQRWRRGRSAGEGSTPVTEVEEETAGLVEEDDGLAAELDPDTETDLDPDEAAEPDEPDDVEDGEDSADAEEETDDDELDDDLDDVPPALPAATRKGFLDGSVAVQLLQAAHAKQAITTALAMALAAAVAGRAARETAVVLVTVLVGQTILGWHNDIVDRQRDKAHGLTGKPVAMGRLSTDTLWYAVLVAALLLVPLAITTGIKAGCLYLASVAVGLLGNVVLRTGLLSWWSWAVSFALLPAYLSFGGWGGQAEGNPPETSIVVLAALLGVGVHFTRAVWGLVADHEDGWTYLPLKLGLKLGATRLLALSTLYTVVIVVLLAVMGAKVGLSR